MSSCRTGQRKCRNRRLESCGESRRPRSSDFLGSSGISSVREEDAARSGEEVGDKARLDPLGCGVRIEMRTGYARERDKRETANGASSEDDIRAAERGGATSSVMRNAEYV